MEVARQKILKRVFDITFSILGLFVTLPLLLLIAILIKIDSYGPVFFQQERIGKNFQPFKILKFRTMGHGPDDTNSPLITVRDDTRITRVGRFLRNSKFDELPQLINVLKGEMSFVGPRPEVRKYVELFEPSYRKLLTLRPGITDPATLKFRAEERLLSNSTNWKDDYIQTVLPAKIELSSEYVDNHTFWKDIKLIVRTLFEPKRELSDE